MTTPTQGLAPVILRPPLVNPAHTGLADATIWTEMTGAARHLLGVEIEASGNYGIEPSSGIWGAAWCGEPGEIVPGDRPAALDAFDPVTAWAHDECDLTAPSQAEVRLRAEQTMRLREPLMIEREFAARALLDAGTPTTVPDLTAAVSTLEAALAETNTVGFIHASTAWMAYAARDHLLGDPQLGGRYRTPAGHTWVFGGGYVAGLGGTPVATSTPFGWRDAVQLREVIDHEGNRFSVLAERTTVIGYEKAIKAATITP